MLLLFEKARELIEHGKWQSAGLLATQGIRGGANREVLKRIKETGDIFFAGSDRDWLLDGANVHVSMIGFDNGAESIKTFDGKAVAEIQPNLQEFYILKVQRIVLAKWHKENTFTASHPAYY